MSKWFAWDMLLDFHREAAQHATLAPAACAGEKNFKNTSRASFLRG
jgi:hypothetical protein